MREKDRFNIYLLLCMIVIIFNGLLIITTKYIELTFFEESLEKSYYILLYLTNNIIGIIYMTYLMINEKLNLILEK